MEAVKNLLNNPQIRAKGMFRFVLEIGFLRWGIPVSILQTNFMYFYRFGFTFDRIGEFMTAQNFLMMILFLLFEGVTFGLVVWHWGNGDLQKLDL